MVLPFAGGVSPPLPVVSLLFSVSYPQPSRSYYLFFNYLFFNYLYGCGVCTYLRRRECGVCTYLRRLGVWCLHVENCAK